MAALTVTARVENRVVNVPRRAVVVVGATSAISVGGTGIVVETAARVSDGLAVGKSDVVRVTAVGRKPPPAVILGVTIANPRQANVAKPAPPNTATSPYR